jgi:hypothetical protein
MATLHGTAGSWNGEIFCVCTGNGHTEPVRWDFGDAPLHTSIHPARDAGSPQVAGALDISTPALVELYFSLDHIATWARGSLTNISGLKQWLSNHRCSIRPQGNAELSLRGNLAWAIPALEQAFASFSDMQDGEPWPAQPFWAVLVTGDYGRLADREEGLAPPRLETFGQLDSCPALLAIVHPDEIRWAAVSTQHGWPRLRTLLPAAAENGRAVS